MLRITHRQAVILSSAALLVLTMNAAAPRLAAAAQTSQNIMMSPASTRLSARPGKSAAGSFDAYNVGTTSFNYKVYAVPYSVHGVHYDPSFTALPGKTDASKWFDIVGKQTGKIDPNKHAHVRYTLRIPPGTAPGGYYATLFAETVPRPTTQGVVATNRVGSIIYITAEGVVRTAGKLEPSFYPSIVVASAVSLPTTISNTGGTHFTTTARTSITNIYGGSVFQAQATRYVLPGTKREIKAHWRIRAPFGLYRVSQSAAILGKRQELPGRWVFVVQWWTLAVVAAAALLLGGWATVRRWRKRLAAAVH